MITILTSNYLSLAGMIEWCHDQIDVSGDDQEYLVAFNGVPGVIVLLSVLSARWLDPVTPTYSIQSSAVSIG